MNTTTKELYTSGKNQSIEFWRFAFALAIVMMHFNEMNQIRQFEEMRMGFLPGAGLGVDFFFLLSGFLLMAQYMRNAELGKDLSPASFLARKILHLYTHYLVAFILLLVWVVFQTQHASVLQFFQMILDQLFKYKWEVFMLHLSEFGEKSYLNFPTWYISIMLICSYFTYALLRLNKNLYLTVLAPLFILVGGGYYANKYGCILIWYDYNGLFNVGWIRAMMDIGLGCLIYLLYRHLAIQIKQWKKWQFGLASLLELLCVSRLVWAVLTHKNARNDFWDLLMMAALIVFSFLQVTCLSRLLNNTFSMFLGRMSLAIYLNQVLFLNLFFQIFGEGKNFALSVAVSSCMVLVGSWCIQFLTNLCVTQMKLYWVSRAELSK